MPVFMTKKQKSLMRARRRKKKANREETEIEKGNEKKRKRMDDEDATIHSNTIVVPAHLNSKEAKKFRKEARRKARAQGQDETLLEFTENNGSKDDNTANENKQEDAPPTRTNKKPKRSFPRINDLLQEQEKLQEKEKQREAQKLAESKIPDAIKSRYLALDCEMVGIGSDGKQAALARVSLVDWHGETMLDTFVKVPSRITDFRTHVSGVTAKHLQNDNAMELHACRSHVGQLLQDKVLVGHALKNDLDALLLKHPKVDIRDTAKYRPFQRASGRNGGKWRPRKLRDLVKEHLDVDIQVEGEAHDSTEDARATMDLFKLVREPWERELEKKQKPRQKR